MKSGTISLTEKAFYNIEPQKLRYRGVNNSHSELNFDEAIEVIEQMIKPKYLNKIQMLVLQYTWQGLSYAEMANTINYDFGYIKDTGSKLWQILSESLGQKVTKQNVQLMLQRYVRRRGMASYSTLRGLPTNRSHFPK